MREVVIIEAVRTPVGRFGGVLKDAHPVDLAAKALTEVVRRAGIQKSDVEDVVMGCVTQTQDQGGNIGRLAVLQAGFPIEVPSVSINRMCGSSQQAVHFGAQAIAAGDADVVIAAGVESMTRVPMGSDFTFDTLPGQFPFDLVPQGISAELIAEQWGLSRAALDQFAFESHTKAAAATKEGRFQNEIMPVTVSAGGEQKTVAVDEGIRMNPDLARMGTLKSPFKENGVVTAANASQISDGAAAILLMSAERAQALGVRPRARVLSRVAVGSDPILMLTGVIPATRKALERAGLSIDDMDAIEVNEAFASVVLSWAQEIEPDMAKVNANGGAIALGHPLGASGARIMTTLLHRLERSGGRYGLQTMCIGWGMATATIIERIGA
ncbi:MAG: thiolase family protein [Chloroflexi bacterium]|nr:thiolase family protein [Chloroflexota bacterium]